MGREQTRKLERAVFELLKERYPDLYDGEVSHEESPEFVVSRPSKRLGLEVTSLHGSNPEQGSPDVQRRAAGGRFFHELEQRVRATGAPCAVTIQLMGPIAGGGRRAKALAEEAFRLLEPALGRPGTSASWSRLARDAGLPPELHSLELHWPSKLKRACLIMGGEAFAISSQFGDPLKQILNAKSAKYESYRRRCDECWLAIVLPHYFEAEDEGVPSPALSAVYETPFERVLLIDLDRDKCWQLKTVSPPTRAMKR